MCVEESMHAEILQVAEWKCMYAPKPKVMQTCNLFDCPKWVAMEWSQVRCENILLVVRLQVLRNTWTPRNKNVECDHSSYSQRALKNSWKTV